MYETGDGGGELGIGWGMQLHLLLYNTIDKLLSYSVEYSK